MKQKISHIFAKAALAAAFVFFAIAVHAADVTLTSDGNGGYYYNMPGYNNGNLSNSTLTITEQDIVDGKSTFKIYDNGGKDGMSHYNVQAELLIIAPMGYAVKITGNTYFTTSKTYNLRIIIYDGDSKSASPFVNSNTDENGRYMGESQIDVQSSTNNALITYQTNNKTHVDGFDLTVTIMKDPYSITYATISGMETFYKYTGTSINLGYSVKDANGTSLTQNTHYTATIKNDGGTVVENAVAEGHYTLTIEGKTPYNGSKTIDFWVHKVPGIYTDPDYAEGATEHLYAKMPKTGTVVIDLPQSGYSSFMIYDDGGKGGQFWDDAEGNHSKYANGNLQINAPEGYLVHLTGYVRTTSSKAFLTVYDGTSTSDATLCKNVHGDNACANCGSYTNVTIDILSSGESILLHFEAGAGNSEGLILTATIMQPTLYNITFDSYTGGTVTAKDDDNNTITQAFPKQTITLDITPDEGYVINYITVTKANGDQISIDGGKWYKSPTSATFTMPVSVATIKPVFIETNNMTASNGLILKNDFQGNISLGDNVHSFNVSFDGSFDCSITGTTGGKFSFIGNGNEDHSPSNIIIYDGTNNNGTQLFQPSQRSFSVSCESTSEAIYFYNWYTYPLNYVYGTLKKVYTIKYNLGGGAVSGTNPKEYDFETETFTLANPTKDGYEFVGWMYDGQTEPVETVIIPKGSTGNKEFTANWKQELGALTLYYYGDRTTATLNGNYTADDALLTLTEDIEVTSVTFDRTFTPDATSTIILPFAIESGKYSGGTFYEFQSVDYEDNKWVASMTKVSGDIEAQKPYLFVPSSDKLTIDGGVTLKACSGAEYADTKGDWTFKGVFNVKSWSKGVKTDYFFASTAATSTNGQSVNAGDFVRIGNNCGLNPFRCYLSYSGSESSLSKSEQQLPSNIEVRLIDNVASVVETDENPSDDRGDITTPVSEIIPNSGTKVWSFDKMIFIESESGFGYQIVDLSGRILKTGVTNSTREEISLGRTVGIVIVKINGKTFKVNY